MVQVPGATSVTVAFETVQTPAVRDAKVTVKPDDAVALTVKGTAPIVTFWSGLNVMVWPAGPG